MIDNNYILVIGSANIDIHGLSSANIVLEESNEGKISICCGGVGRNISENLAKIGEKVTLVTSLGDDYFSSIIKSNCAENNIDSSYSAQGKNVNSSSYLAIMDVTGNMKLALADMSLSDNILTPKYLKSIDSVIANSKVIVTDAGLRRDVLEYIFTNYGHKRIFHDPASIKKASHVKGLTKYLDTLKVNSNEASYLSDIEINDKDDIIAAANFFLNEGVDNIFITCGSDGVYYGSKSSGILYIEAPKVDIVNVTGAGDCFTAGVVYGFVNGYTIEDTAKFATAMVSVNLQNSSTVSPYTSMDEIKKYL